ncbi:hypothetical protein [Victivallis vadensis]|uniref:hypothetical protein n=1 Tax=Victivallis vadensis TaxID=172901 RepID=UPI0023F90A77|nr:hypothetical protein [Victivallis vadensis]
MEVEIIFGGEQPGVLLKLSAVECKEHGGSPVRESAGWAAARGGKGFFDSHLFGQP